MIDLLVSYNISHITNFGITPAFHPHVASPYIFTLENVMCFCFLFPHKYQSANKLWSYPSVSLQGGYKGCLRVVAKRHKLIFVHCWSVHDKCSSKIIAHISKDITINLDNKLADKSEVGILDAVRGVNDKYQVNPIITDRICKEWKQTVQK